MSEWPRYESHKVVRAAKIVGVEIKHVGGEIVLWVRPDGQEFDNARIEQFEPNMAEMKERARVGDWAMLYPDGYKSVSPAKAFEEGYTVVQD